MTSLQEYIAALTPARDRRVEPRTTPASLNCVSLGGGDGIILNISKRGMAVALDRAHAVVVGEYLPRIHFQLPVCYQRIEISAKVMWLSESGKGAGIRFVDPPESVRNHISNWVGSERTALEFEHLPRLIHRDTRPTEISSGKSRVVFSSKSIFSKEAAAPYAEMFPSETASATITAAEDVIKHENEQAPAAQAATVPIQFMTSSEEGSPSRDDDAALHLNLDPSQQSVETGFKFQFAALASLLVAVSFILGLTAGYAPIGKGLLNARKSVSSVTAAPSRPPNVSSEPKSDTPSDDRFDKPSMGALDTEESPPKISSAPSRPRSEDLSAPANPTDPSSKPNSHGEADFRRPPDTRRKTEAASTDAKARATVSRSWADITSKDAKSSAESETSAESAKRPNQPSSSTNSNAGSSPSTVPSKPEPAYPPTVGSSTVNTPPEAGPRNATAAAPYASPGPATVAIPATEAGKLVRAVFPRKSVPASPSLAITSQLSVLISPESRSSAGYRQTARLQAGGLISYVEPHQPRAVDQYRSTETVKVRATISRAGQVTEVRPITGPIFLLSSAITAVRQWRFRPTFLNGSPVQAQQDVTIEFLPAR